MIRPAPHPVFWVIAVALSVLALAELSRSPLFETSPALAQPVSSGGSRGVFGFTGQLSKNSFGVFMVDMDAMTLWAYEYNAQRGCLRLAAARTWRYDRYLENFNICDLPPEAVEQMIEDQRRYKLESNENQVP